MSSAINERRVSQFFGRQNEQDDRFSDVRARDGASSRQLKNEKRRKKRVREH
jgi:hypothetical protein